MSSQNQQPRTVEKLEMQTPSLVQPYATKEQAKPTLEGGFKNADEYEAMINALKMAQRGTMALTPEAMAAERKRQARQRMVAGIGDAINAMSNMWATTQYVPNAYRGNQMSEAMQKRHDAINAERERAGREWLDYQMKINSAQLGKKKDDEAKEQQRLMNSYRQLQLSLEASKVNAANEAQRQQARKYGADADVKEIERKYAEMGQLLDLDNKRKSGKLTEARTYQANTGAQANLSRARKLANEGQGKIHLNVEGGLTFASSQDYEGAVNTYADRLGISRKEVYQDGWEGYGSRRKPKYKTRDKSTAQLHAEVESKWAEQHPVQSKENNIPGLDELDEDVNIPGLN